jgi:hypothetical protein
MLFKVDAEERYLVLIRRMRLATCRSILGSKLMFSFPVYYSRIEPSFSSVVLLVHKLEKLTPRFICPRRLVCTFSSLVEKTLSVPGKSRKPRYQSDLVYGERVAFIRLTRSISEVTSVLVPIRASVPRIDKRVSVQHGFSVHHPL